jgi:hypothetical protein
MVKISRNIKKPGTPLGGVGAERVKGRAHSLVLDDRLISKQFISNKADSKVSDAAFGGSWSTVTDVAPSKQAVHAYLNSLSVSTSAWTQEDASAGTSKTKTFDSGNVGIGSTLAYSAIDEKLVVDGNVKAVDFISTGDANIGDDLSLSSDASILNFGADSDVNLTHVADTGLLLNSSRQLQFGDSGTYIHQSADGILNLVSDTEIEINASTIDMNGAADISGNLTVGGNTTITGNLTVNGTATAIHTTNTTINDNIIVLNNDVTGTPSENAGVEVERGTSTNVAIRWNESTDTWQITNDGSTYNNIRSDADAHDAITIDNQGTGLLSLSSQAIAVNDVMVKNSGDTMTGQLVLSGTSGSSGTTALSVTGGNSSASNAAVSITGHLEASTKSFNIPHPLLENKRLVYGSLEGPEHGMYARGSFDVNDERRVVAIDLPLYWSSMVNPDYTVSLASYGNYNVWINDRTEDGFWVETNAGDDWSFDWNVIGCRKDAKLEVEPDA